MESAVISMG